MTLFELRPDVVVATSPQFFSAIGGWAVRLRPLVFELRDVWPASIVAVGALRRSLVIRAPERLEMFLYQHAAAIAAAQYNHNPARRALEAQLG
jgi:colanic acid biosynthesis glycosyl transferase WcaI